MATTFTVEEMLDHIEIRIDKSSLRKVAMEIGISPAYLSDITRKRRDISEQVAEKLGFERIVKTEVVFKKVKL